MAFCLVAIAALALMSTLVPSTEAHDDFRRCLNTSIETPLLTTANSTCVTELDLNTNRHSGHNMCLRACVLRKVGVLTAGDAINSAGVATFVDATFPAAARAALKTGILACSTTPLDEVTAANVAQCGKYKSLLKCIKKATKEPCKPPKPASLTSNPGHVVQLLSHSSAAGQVIQLAVEPTNDSDEDKDGDEDDDDDK